MSHKKDFMYLNEIDRVRGKNEIGYIIILLNRESQLLSFDKRV
jgi:hypothetical protein